MIRPAAVFFDLDGTLVDSAPDLAAAANAMRSARGLAQVPYEQLRPLAGSGARGMLSGAFGRTPGDDDYVALRDEFHDRYEQCMLERTHAFDGIEALLARLHGHGLPWGIVTNKARRFAAPLVAAMAPLGGAATLVCGDCTPHTKPHPAPLHEAARRLAIDPARCIYVGDDRRDVDAGHAAGMQTVAAAWGYLGPGADVRAWSAAHVIAAPAELLNWLDLA
ncbi:MAG: HAD-IA family hydrolase [Betaproteobacteria bacterium]|nr:HAD-IA family hydrolase [Betaproteobacteria bacterium]